MLRNGIIQNGGVNKLGHHRDFKVSKPKGRGNIK